MARLVASKGAKAQRLFAELIDQSCDSVPDERAAEIEKQSEFQIGQLQIG